MFENVEQAKEQLRKEKMTVLEGYVTEYIYKRQFLDENPDMYTNGWWIAVKGGRKVFFVVKEYLNDVDHRVLANISKKYSCFRAYPQGEVWRFTDITLEHDNVSSIDQEELKKVCKLGEKEYKLEEPDCSHLVKYYERIRILKCLDFFSRNALLVPVAIERNFANDVLEKYFDYVVNIDYFTINSEGNINVEEIKYKNETVSTGNFGINVGQAYLFEILETLNFTIHHNILYKKEKKTIFEFMTMESEDKYWLEGVLTGFSGRDYHIAPSKTSVHRNRKQKYIEFEKENFHRIPLRQELFEEVFSEKVYVVTYDKYKYYHMLRNCEKIKDTDDRKVLIYDNVETAKENGYQKPCRYCALIQRNKIQ